MLKCGRPLKFDSQGRRYYTDEDHYLDRQLYTPTEYDELRLSRPPTHSNSQPPSARNIEIVRRIDEDGATQADIAKAYGISKGRITSLVQTTRWRLRYIEHWKAKENGQGQS